MKQKTALETLLLEFFFYKKETPGYITLQLTEQDFVKVIDKAFLMERWQIENAFEMGSGDGCKYYQETYLNENNDSTSKN
jgi:hypothetical protein